MLNKFRILLMIFAIPVIILFTHQEVAATHGLTHHILDSATKEQRGDMYLFTSNVLDTVPFRNVLFDQAIIFGYAWIDISELTGISFITHPGFSHLAPDSQSWHTHSIHLDPVIGYEENIHGVDGRNPVYCVTSLGSSQSTHQLDGNMIQINTPQSEIVSTLGDIDYAWAFSIVTSDACSSGLAASVYSMEDVTFVDPFVNCSGLSGEALLLCKGNATAFDSGGSCEGLSSLECLNESIDLDEDGIHNDADLCPDEPETINGINDDDGCPEYIPTYTPNEIKNAYGGLTNKIHNTVPSAILEYFELDQIPEKVENAKMDTRIFTILDLSATDEYAESTGLDFKDDFVRVLVTTDGTDIRDQLDGLGVVEISRDNLFQLELDIKNIENVSNIDAVQSINTIQKGIQTGIFVSEGVKSIHAENVQKVGLSGDGVKIAVFDLAFDPENPEIKDRVIEAKSFRHNFDNSLAPVKGVGNEYVHGTAVTEIILDVAPDAEVYLYTFQSQLEFLDALSYAQIKNMNLMTMSVGWMSFPTDGSSLITNEIEKVIDSGISFVVSAGNYAETHWEGKFVDSNNNGWHEFEGDDEGLSFGITNDRVLSKIPISVFLMWDNVDGQQNDLDLILTDSNGDTVATSANVQGVNQKNMEYISFVPKQQGVYTLGASTVKNISNANLEIFSQNDMLEYPVPKGSVSVPTDAKGIISVGAMHHSKGVLEPFSSQGPTNHNLGDVPYVVGPDAVTTDSFDGSLFYGTSASAPHVAGAVALMLNNNPTLTPVKISEDLKKNTDRTHTLKEDGHDNFFGHGFVDTLFLAQSKSVVVDIPSWIKNNAGWWAQGMISDDDFVAGIEYLVNNGIVSVPTSDGGDPQILQGAKYEKPGYTKTQNVKIDGAVIDYIRGSVVTIVITTPEGEINELGISATRDGNYSTIYVLNNKSQIGTYDVSVQYNSEEIDSPSFVVVGSTGDLAPKSVQIPGWIKNNSDWWSKDMINNDDFVSGIQYLIENRIMNIK